jgi:predicted transcriptional regulator
MTALSAEVQELVRQEMARGNYSSVDDRLIRALRVLAARREDIEAIEEGLADYAAGRFVTAEEFDREFEAKLLRRGFDDIAAGRTIPFEEFDRDFRERNHIDPPAEG